MSLAPLFATCIIVSHLHKPSHAGRIELLYQQITEPVLPVINFADAQTCWLDKIWASTAQQADPLALPGLVAIAREETFLQCVLV